LSNGGKVAGILRRAEGLDLLIGSWLLTAEVVREARRDQALVLILLVDRLQRGVLLGVAALGRDVHDEQHLAFVGLQRGRLAVDVLDRDGRQLGRASTENRRGGE